MPYIYEPEEIEELETSAGFLIEAADKLREATRASSFVEAERLILESLNLVEGEYMDIKGFHRGASNLARKEKSISSREERISRWQRR